jgi:hypothetical protein
MPIFIRLDPLHLFRYHKAISSGGLHFYFSRALSQAEFDRLHFLDQFVEEVYV